MSSVSPHTQLSPSGRSGSAAISSGAGIKTEPEDEDAKGRPKQFACDKCGKRYARRDYLDRHALNHEERNFKCNACGKGFARIDVLKKHEVVACKVLRAGQSSTQGPAQSQGQDQGRGVGGASGPARMAAQVQPEPPETRRNGNGNDFPIPRATTGLPRIVPRDPEPSGSIHRPSQPQPDSQAQGQAMSESPVEVHGGWRKRQRRSVESISSHSSEEEGYSDRRHQPYPYPHIFQSTINPPPHTHTPFATHQRYSHVSGNVGSTSTSVHMAPQLPTLPTSGSTSYSMPLVSPTRPRDMSISLAPAYALTPDVSGLGPDTDHCLPKIEPEGHRNSTHHTALDSLPLSGSTDHRAYEPDPTQGSGPTSGGPDPGGFEMPAKVGENMDDLLSWLFNTNAPGTGGDWGLGIQQSQPQQEILPTFSADPVGPQNEQLNDAYPSYFPANTQADTVGYGDPQPYQPRSSSQAQNTSNAHSQVQEAARMPNHGAGLSGAQSQTASTRRYPQPYHPLYIPNIPGKTDIPTFHGSGNERASIQGRERYSEVIDDQAKDAMLDLFEGPGRRELMSPAFSVQRMRLYLELYFMHFAPLYPIIHQPSLRYRRLPPDLLLALICIGTAFAEDKEGLRIASKLHKRLRNRIFEMVEDEPKASVHSLQTLLLINHFSRSYCSLKEHDISQIFHSPSVYMIKLAGTLLPKFNRQNNVSDDPVTCWLDWVGEEERKRLGWFAFMMDLENAALYRHFLMIHCYFMEIPFPTSSSSWTAPDPFAWSTALRQSLSLPTPSFRNALRELAGRGTVPPNLNDQSLWILIHGLINVSWTLLWRDLGELSMVHENKITGWKDSLRRAFKTWVGHVEGRAAVCEEALYTVGIPFAQLGSILLLSDTEEIRIFAGASSESYFHHLDVWGLTSDIAGRSISPGEWTAANTYVHAWARSQDGAYACYTAIELLSQVYKWSAEDRWATAPAFIPWCTYVSSLIIWAYSTALDGPDSLTAPYIIPTTSSRDKPLEHGQRSEIRIEPSLARRAAQSFLSNMLVQTRGEAFALPDVQGKNACAGVLAYTAYLMGVGGRGVLDEARRVLLGLLGEG